MLDKDPGASGIISDHSEKKEKKEGYDCSNNLVTMGKHKVTALGDTPSMFWRIKE